MQKYTVGQQIAYSAELFLIRGEYKKLQRTGKGQIIQIYPNGYYHVFNGIRILLIHKSDIL